MAWAKFPSKWIRDGQLKRITWQSYKGGGSAALLILIAMCIHRNRQRAEADRDDLKEWLHITYDELTDLTRLSRSLVARGLHILLQLDIVIRDASNRSDYRIPGVSTSGEWCKLPQSYLLDRGRLKSFDWVLHRREAYLDAMKIYMVMLAYRNNTTGFTHIGFDNIAALAGVAGANVRGAKSLLIANGLLHSESDPDRPRVDAGRAPYRYIVRGLSRG